LLSSVRCFASLGARGGVTQSSALRYGARPFRNLQSKIHNQKSFVLLRDRRV